MYQTDYPTIRAIAEGYKEHPDQIGLVGLTNIRNFHKLINSQFSYLSKRIHFHFVDTEPYKYDKIEQLMPDFRKGVIQVNSTGNNSGLWGPFYNLQFRAIHDFIHCVHKLNFDFKDEIQAFNRQLELSLQDRFAGLFPQMDWLLYEKVLRSEIVYQAAVKTFYKEFHIDQKIILNQL